MGWINRFEQPLETIGTDLVRPECVLTTAKRDIYVSDFRGGVTQISPDGSQQFFGGEHPDFGVLQTNGFALQADGSFLIAHLGAEQGGIFQVDRDNRIHDWLLEVEGKALPPSNFVYLDHQGRIWITVSTRTQPRADAYRKSCDDGFIVLVDDKGARIVADGLGYTNEVWVNPESTELYVNCTFTRELIRYTIVNDELVNPIVITQFGAGIYPDGLTQDTSGHFWVTSIVSNRVVRVAPDGATDIWLEDCDDDHLRWVEDAYQTDSMGRPHLDKNPASTLANISSLAFGEGHLLLGCLLDNKIVKIPTALAGVKPAHWDF